MRGAVFTGDRECEVRDVEVPEIGHGEVLIRIGASGICGSDLHVYRAETSSDQIRGHEPAGTVVEAGDGVVRVNVGDRVAVHHHHGCGVCEQCVRGETVACRYDHQVFGVHRPGSFAEFTTAHERNCIPLPDSLTLADGACMCCVGTTAFAALRRLQARAGQTLAVFGLGPVGLSCVLVGKAMNLKVIGADIIRKRLQLAESCGADAVVDAGDGDVVDAVRSFSRDKSRGAVEGADCLIETSGADAARRWVIACLRRQGRAAVLGVGDDGEVINPTDIHGRACTIIGSVVFPLGWMWDLCRFMVRTDLTFETMVTHRFDLEDAAEALSMADSGHCGKVLIIPNMDAW